MASKTSFSFRFYDALHYLKLRFTFVWVLFCILGLGFLFAFSRGQFSSKPSKSLEAWTIWSIFSRDSINRAQEKSISNYRNRPGKVRSLLWDARHELGCTAEDVRDCSTWKNGPPEPLKYKRFDVFSIEIDCPEGKLQRIGGSEDGGKWICGLEDMDSSPTCVIYSLGSNNDFSFEYSVLDHTKYCKVFTFDCTVKEEMVQIPSKYKDRLQFYSICVGEAERSQASEKFLPLEAIAESLGHERISYLKMDIEGWEFPVFSDLLTKEDSLLPDQIGFEIHWETYVPVMRETWRTVGEVALLADRLFLAGYRILSMEPNPTCFHCMEIVIVRFDKNALEIAEGKTRAPLPLCVNCGTTSFTGYQQLCSLRKPNFPKEIKSSLLPFRTLSDLRKMSCPRLYSEMEWTTRPVWDKNERAPTGGMTTPRPDIPKLLEDRYTMLGRIPVIFSYSAEAQLDASTYEIKYTRKEMDMFMEQSRQGTLKGTYGVPDSNLLAGVLGAYIQAVEHQRGVVVGTQNPWVESIILAKGGSHVTTVEWGNLNIDHPQVRVMKPHEFEVEFHSLSYRPFDFGVSFSSIEHDGLGRYGDSLNPEGDLQTMSKLSCMIKPGGFLFLSVPIGPDALVFNLHRIYGEERLPTLLANWILIDVFPSKFDVSKQGEYIQPILVLQNTRGCII